MKLAMLKLVRNRLAACLAVVGLLAASTQAQISVTNTDIFADQGDVSSGYTLSGFSLNGGNTVVALVSHEDNGPNGLDVTYGGATADGFLTGTNSSQIASVYYWINVSSGLDLSVTPGGSDVQDTLGVTALALSGVGGALDTATASGDANLDLVYDGDAGGLAVAAFTDNTFGTSGAASLVSGNLSTVTQAQGGGFEQQGLGSDPTGGEPGSAGFLHAYGSIGSMNTFTDTIQEGDGGSSRNAAALVAFTTMLVNPPNQWITDGGGNFGDAANWSAGVPTAGDNVVFGSALSMPNEPATIALNVAPTLNSVEFNNANQYIVAGPSTLTLTGDREISTILEDESHIITANIAGTSGVAKTGAGTLVFSGAKSYTGTTDIQAGTLNIDNLDAIDNQAAGSVNIAANGRLALLEGSNGTLAAQLAGADSGENFSVVLDTGEQVNDVVTISRSNPGFGGSVQVRGGTLQVSNSTALGSGGGTGNRTVVERNSSAKVALSGGANVADELLTLNGRTNDNPSLTSAGNNTWGGDIDGQGSGNTRLNIESTSGTLMLGELYARDDGSLRTFVFSGAGNTTVTGRISDAAKDFNTDIVTVKTSDNVGVTKRGAGTLTIQYATDLENDYWFGPTVIEEGTVVVNDDSDVGELRSSDIAVQKDGVLDVSAFDEYSQQAGQTLRGGGTIVANTLALFDDGSLAPGDSVGTLNVTGSASLSAFAQPGQEGTWSFDVGNSTDTSGDLLAISGGFTAEATALTVNVTPAHGHLDDGAVPIVTHGGDTNSNMSVANVRITDADGNVLNTRQSVSLQSTTNAINIDVTGTEAPRTWNGNVSGAWEVDGAANWQESDQQYEDLDHVTFDDSASGTTNVTINSRVSPADNGKRFAGSVTFDNDTKDYTFSGNGGIIGTGAVNVTGTGEVTLGNTGNNYSGTTTINAGSSLRMTSASTGSITNSGTLSLGTEQTIDLIVQDGAAMIGSGNHRVLAFEAEEFQENTINMDQNEAMQTVSRWTVRNDIPGSSGAGANGEALYASEDVSNTATSTAEQNFVTYNLQFTEPGSYQWFLHMVSTDGGDGNSTPDGDAGNDDSFFAPTADMNSGNTDPAAVGSRIENYGDGRIAAEGSPVPLPDFTDPTALTYDWYRNGTSGTQVDEFHTIDVTQADVDAGTVFKFKVATREGGMTLDKFVFVADDDYSTLPFGTVTDMNLEDATSISPIQDTFTSAGTVLDVNGDFTMSAGSTLNMLISSTSLHDQLDVSGLLTAAGTLNIDVGGSGFSAQEGDVFDIFDFDEGMATGSFDEILLPELSGLAWDTSKLLTTGELSVIEAAFPLGDFTGDGQVDGADLSLLLGNWGSDVPPIPEGWNGTAPEGPLVDGGELSALLGTWGEGVAAASLQAQNVPEPSSMVLLTLAGIAAAAWKRRRA